MRAKTEEVKQSCPIERAAAALVALGLAADPEAVDEPEPAPAPEAEPEAVGVEEAEELDEVVTAVAALLTQRGEIRFSNDLLNKTGTEVCGDSLRRDRGNKGSQGDGSGDEGQHLDNGGSIESGGWIRRTGTGVVDDGEMDGIEQLEIRWKRCFWEQKKTGYLKQLKKSALGERTVENRLARR
ncbi:hypothetical protein MMC17_009976 [Xylographa soralifera]|nr:hypothetical protein [Xylographa soralifera]